MEVVPASVGVVARQWDEQHLDVAAAAKQIAGVSSAGFTDTLAPAVDRFAQRWRDHTGHLALRCERQADGLRAALTDYLATDRGAAWTFQQMTRNPGLALTYALVEEVR